MNKDNAEKTVHVIQGEYAIGCEDNVVQTTVLGSCVAACFHDPIAKVGGINHFLLPDNGVNDSNSIIYGAQAMELLINGLLKHGARKDRLQAKLFGGAQVLNGLTKIGEKNAAFALRFLNDEGIACISHSLGGTNARRVRYWPTTGRASQKLIGSADTVEAPVAAPKPPKANIELF